MQAKVHIEAQRPPPGRGRSAARRTLRIHSPTPRANLLHTQASAPSAGARAPRKGRVTLCDHPPKERAKTILDGLCRFACGAAALMVACAADFQIRSRQDPPSLKRADPPSLKWAPCMVEQAASAVMAWSSVEASGSMDHGRLELSTYHFLRVKKYFLITFSSCSSTLTKSLRRGAHRPHLARRLL